MNHRLARVSAPSVDLVSLAEAKEHARVETPADETALAAMVRGAIERLDGPAGILGRALVTQTWKLTLDGWPAEIELPLPPLQAVDGITYAATDGTTKTLASDAYQVAGIGDENPAVIWPADAWPRLGKRREAVTVTFTAGYGDADAVPEPIRQAALAIATGLYDGRDGDLAEVDALLVPFRVWAF